MALKRYELIFFFFYSNIDNLGLQMSRKTVMALKRKELPLIDES